MDDSWRLRFRHDLRSGFTMFELLIVLIIGLILTFIAVPNMLTVISNARLRGGASNLSGVLQDCRMRAVKEYKTKTARFTTYGNGPVVYLKDATDNSAVVSTDVQAQLGAPLTRMTSLAESGAPSALGTATLGFNPDLGDPSFNSRGLPCLYAGGNCPNTGFVYYFKDTRLMGQNAWTAVTISPAGRIKRWFWNDSAWTD